MKVYRPSPLALVMGLRGQDWRSDAESTRRERGGSNETGGKRSGVKTTAVVEGREERK